jgi:hypothetical protein
MALDKITEAIAHFIGYFQIALEQARLRESYQEFSAGEDIEQTEEELAALDYAMAAPHEFLELEPELRYVPGGDAIEEIATELLLTLSFWPGPAPWMVLPRGSDLPNQAVASGFSVTADRSMAMLTPPASVVAIIAQQNMLSDNDVLSMGGAGFILADPGLVGDPTLLLEKASAVAPLGGASLPGSPEAMRDFVTGTGGTLEAAIPPQDHDRTFVHHQPTLTGTAVDGQWVTEAPALADHRIGRGEEEAAEPAQPAGMSNNGAEEAIGQSVSATVDGQSPRSVEADFGSNTLINEATLISAMLDGAVIAAMGDSHEVNAIIQANVWSDTDLVGGSVLASLQAIGGGTKSFNIASFEREALAATPPQGASGAPTGFAFTRIDGDLIFMNWLQQINFVTDNDVATLSTGGMTTMIGLGGNMAFNGISLAELGQYYDLILIGGGLYDANIIRQVNVLADDDVVGGLAGFATGGNGLIATGGNLLWNQATISTIGSADRFEALPAAFGEAASRLADNDFRMPGAVYADSAFVGLAGLRVLYVSGDLIDIQYICQTNVLGDCDQVALTMARFDPDTGASWKIATGGNELINSARIFDVDAGGKTYVGGERFSDEFLFQSELVDFNLDLHNRPADALANEAIAFFADDADAPPWTTDQLPPSLGHLGADAPDGLQSMLA